MYPTLEQHKISLHRQEKYRRIPRMQRTVLRQIHTGRSYEDPTKSQPTLLSVLESASQTEVMGTVFVPGI